MRMIACFAVTLLGACSLADPCAAGGRGRLGVRLVGLDGPVEIRLTGPASYTMVAERTASAPDGVAYLPDAPTGRYRVEVDAYAKNSPSPRVRVAYAPTHDAEICPGNVNDIVFTVLPNSGMLWMLNGSGGSGSPLGFADADVAMPSVGSGPLAQAKGNTGAGGDLAFDRQGQLWTFAGTTADADLQRYSPQTIATAGARQPNLELNIAPARDCGPFAASLAFDGAGNAWVGSRCKKQVFKLDTPGRAANKSTLTPSVVLGGLLSVEGIAFDRAGNLWVADPAAGAVRRFDVERLSSSTDGWSATVKVRASDDPMNGATLGPGELAFDATGALWGSDFGANLVFKLPAESLTASGEREQNPSVRIAIAVNALLEGLAFDDELSLWMPLSVGTFGRLRSAQLGASTSPGAPAQPEVIRSPDVAYAQSPAWFPAARESPLAANLATSN